MRSKFANWELENEWLNAFAGAFVHDTRRMVRDLGIEVDEGCVVVCGSARNYYAVQLAIHCVQTFNRGRSPFAMTQLTLEVDDHALMLSILHQAEPVQVPDASTKTMARLRELTFA